jgi:hypothetical protein
MSGMSRTEMRAAIRSCPPRPRGPNPDWPAYNASLTHEQRAAKRICWAWIIAKEFSKTQPDEAIAFKWAWSVPVRTWIYRSFNAGLSRATVLGALQRAYKPKPNGEAAE